MTRRQLETMTSLLSALMLLLAAPDWSAAEGLCTVETCLGLVNTTLNCSYLGCTEYYFANATGLAVSFLDLRGNQLTSITSLSVFSETLTRVDFSQNSISSIARDAFTNCGKLSTLVLTSNVLTVEVFLKSAMDNPIYALNSLKDLQLASNRLGDLVNQPFHSDAFTLEKLNLSSNNIRAISINTLTDHQHLKILDLSHNVIDQLGDTSFRGLTSLLYLDLSYNRLIKLPKFFCRDCRRLAFLDISSNAIQAIDPFGFGHLDSLSTLYMREYRGQAPPISLPASLQHLYLDDSPELTVLGGADLDPLYGNSLQMLSVTNCQSLRNVSRAFFASMSRLSTVNISRNRKLERLSSDVFGDARLSIVFLNLSGNSLTSLDAQLVGNWEKVTTLDLTGNYWDCSCNLEWLHQLNVSQTLQQTLTCYTPLYRRGSRLVDIDHHVNMSCTIQDRYRREAAIGLTVLATLLFLAFGALLVVKCRYTLLPRLFDPGSKYETLYSATEAAFESEEAVHIITASAADCHDAIDAGDFKALPVHV